MAKHSTPAVDTSSDEVTGAPGVEARVRPGTHSGCAGWEIQSFGNMDAYLQSERFPIRCKVHNCDAWECFEGEDTVVGGPKKLKWGKLPDDYIEWGCPDCGMNHSGAHHSQEQADACLYKPHAPECGFFCNCETGDRGKFHGNLVSNPCPNAECNHCNWSGTFPEPPADHVPLNKKERENPAWWMGGKSEADYIAFQHRYEATLAQRDALLIRAKDLIEKLWELAEQADDEDVHPDEDCPNDDTCECPLPNLLNDVHRDIRKTLIDG